MSKRKKRNSDLGRRGSRLRCPICHQRLGFNTHRQGLADRINSSLSPLPGDLTQCDHCLTMLEYGGELISLTLHQASRKRVEEFNKLSRDGYRQPRISELINYVNKYRQMPKRSSDLFRSQISKPIEMVNER
jgi:hypothetical protein